MKLIAHIVIKALYLHDSYMFYFTRSYGLRPTAVQVYFLKRNKEELFKKVLYFSSSLGFKSILKFMNQNSKLSLQELHLQVSYWKLDWPYLFLVLQARLIAKNTMYHELLYRFALFRPLYHHFGVHNITLPSRAKTIVETMEFPIGQFLS